MRDAKKRKKKLKGEEPPNTGGGRVFLPRCSTWSSGHTPAPGAPGCFSAMRSAFVV